MIKNRTVLKRVFRYSRVYARYIGWAVVFILAANLIAIRMPVIMRDIIDRGIRPQDSEVILSGCLLLIGLGLLRSVLTFYYGLWSEKASQGVAYDLRNELHRKLHQLSFSFHDRTEGGQLLTRAVSDVERIRFLSGRAFLRLVELSVLVTGAAVSMLLIKARLAALVLLIVPFIAIIANRFGSRFRPLSRVIQRREGKLTTRLEQNLRGSRIVKAFGQEEEEIRRFQRDNEQLLGKQIEAARLRAFFLPGLTLLTTLGTVIILMYGGSMALRGELSIGELVAFSAYISQVLVPVRRLGFIVASISQATASGERIFEVLDEETEIRDVPGAKPLRKGPGELRFENVSFAYHENAPTLTHIDFTAHPGETVAVLGTTGSGKTSVINMIPRFYDPVEGRVLLDGQDLRGVTLKSLREEIGMVLQESLLFATTIAENLAFGRPGATRDEIRDAARLAFIHDHIASLPDGYDTEVGERGLTLSGGQKQRIAIARAIVKDPKILILDDATSSVDTETEHQIQNALENLMEGRTTFIIAQRLSTVRRADMVLVLEHGRISAWARRTPEASPHEQLLIDSPLYAEICAHQLIASESNAKSGQDKGAVRL